MVKTATEIMVLENEKHRWWPTECCDPLQVMLSGQLQIWLADTMRLANEFEAIYGAMESENG
jgi:hypothetical protein